MTDRSLRLAIGHSEVKGARRAFVSVSTLRKWERDPRLVTSGRLRRKCERYYRKLRAALRVLVALDLEDADEIGPLSEPGGEPSPVDVGEMVVDDLAHAGDVRASARAQGRG